MATNPVIMSDYPDPDVIRVGNTYYMASTTMHMFPGAVILRSYNLTDWEHLCYVYESSDETPARRLENGTNIYGKGMWAPSLRYHKGRFFLFFTANDTRMSYLYSSESITGPWECKKIEGLYHDASLLFDDDDRTYIVYGNGDIHITELKPDLSGPLEGGTDKIIISDHEYVALKYEGSHAYKIRGKYYIFLIHWIKYGECRRVEACYCSDKPDGEYRGANIYNNDMGYFNNGIAQGGIVDTPDGRWYAILFQDRGAAGRMPCVLPVEWKNDFPVIYADGKQAQDISITSTDPDHKYNPLFEDDDFLYDEGESLKLAWQWNHIPDRKLWSVTDRKGAYRIYSGDITRDICQCKNTLTQRMFAPNTEACVDIDVSGLKDGDTAGICVLQEYYAYIGILCESDRKYAVIRRYTEDGETECMRIDIEGNIFRLYVKGMFEELRDTCSLGVKIGEKSYESEEYRLRYTLRHFMGARIGLFMMSTEQTGGYADFMRFRIKVF